MLYKLMVAMLVTWAISAGPAFGLRLGELAIHSRLNQPLDAEIELLQVDGLSSAEIWPNLATRDDFNRAGVKRLFFLSDIEFETVAQGDGRMIIRVTSHKPVVEPFLNFLIEVHWPAGHLLREYSVLLDPPSFSARVTEEAASRKHKPEPQTDADRPRRIPDAVVAASPTPDSSSLPLSSPLSFQAPSEESANFYNVRKDETLWNIALRFRPDQSVLPQQMMLAIQADNPDAFIDGNINRLREGSVLRIPDRSVLQGFSGRDAIAEVAEQNARWRGGVRQWDASFRPPGDDKPGNRQDEGRLTVVSSGDNEGGEGADQGGGSGDLARTRALENELALSAERMDLLTRENAELNDRLDALMNQVETLKRVVELKNSQLAAMQATDENPARTDSFPPSAGDDEIDYNYQNQAVDDSGAVVQASDSVVIDDAETRRERSLIDEFLDNPLYMEVAGGGLLVIVLGLIVIVVVRRRRAQTEDVLQDASIDDSEMFSSEEDGQIDLGPGARPVAESVQAATDIQSLEPDADLAIDHDLPDQSDDATGSVLEDVDVYVNYGQLPQAAEALVNAIKAEPDNTDYRLKLMEVQASMGDLEGFGEQLGALGDMDESMQARVEQLKSQFADATPADFGPEDASHELDAMADDLDLDLDLDDVSSDLASADAPDLATPENEAGTESVDGDVSLDVDEMENAGLSADDLDLDLELDDADSNGASSEDGSDDLADLDNMNLDLDDDGTVSDTEEVTNDLSLADESDMEPLDTPESVELDDIDMDLVGLDAEDAGDVQSAPSAEEEIPSVVEGEDSAGFESLSLDEDFDENLATLSGESDTVLDEIELDGAEFDLDTETSVLDTDDPTVADDMVVADEMDTELPDLSEPLTDVDGADEVATKLDLARAYIEMGDRDGARDILAEVAHEGDDAQKQEVRRLLEKL